MRMIKFCLALSLLAQYPGLFSLFFPLRIASRSQERVSGGGRCNKPSSDTRLLCDLGSVVELCIPLCLYLLIDDAP